MNGRWYRWQNDTLFLKIRLHPGAKTKGASVLLESQLRINVKSQPVNGKANKELLAMLACDFGTKKAQIRISNGELSRDKVIEIYSPVKFPKWFVDLTRKKESC